MMENWAQEILPHLTNKSRPDVQLHGLEVLYEISCSSETMTIFKESTLLNAIVDLLLQGEQQMINAAGAVLINISSFDEIKEALLKSSKGRPSWLLQVCLQSICDANSSTATICSVVLANLSRSATDVDFIVAAMNEFDIELQTLFDVFSNTNFNPKQKMSSLGSFLSNLTQIDAVRSYILEHKLLELVFPFFQYKDSWEKRKAAVSLVRNCCLGETRFHDWVLDESVDFLSYILLPLAGNEEYSEEDNDLLPLQLQYLPEDKLREEDPEIRKMLLETLLQLCAFKKNREYIRRNNTYAIIRELYKWEKDAAVLQACNNLISILIRVEDEINLENLKNVSIPDEISKAELESPNLFVVSNKGGWLKPT